MLKILFVCHGNICRSTMAEAIAKYLIKENKKEQLFHIESAGTSEDAIDCSPYRETVRVLKENNISPEVFLKGKRARKLNAKEYDEWDFFIAMDKKNKYNMEKLFSGDEKNKIHLIKEYIGKDEDVADPWYTRDFEKTYTELMSAIPELLKITNN